ncbi:MAG: sigma-70 family RNA polymerase sigma factor [Candidatus Promineifilaceae bacterium]|nr:sigma-70 family RNA polymerase sigma factor [Candidatus Promineifilaceae bacterium]
MTILTDNLLLERIRRGDTTSFETLFHRHYDRVYGLLFRLVGNRAEAEELTQETFVKLYRHIFKPSPARKVKESLGKEENISAWLYRVATNLGYDALRSRKRRWARNTMLVPDPEGSPAAEAEIEQKEKEAAVRDALAQLPPRQGQLLLLRQMGLSYAQCAEACAVAPGSVGTMIARAARAFREIYENVGEENE